ncbi:MAG: hypothetical protein QOG09_237 [Solirubrobacterales bacterium]|nr:hypothetical protein [Solirubrobacterales bacterium]
MSEREVDVVVLGSGPAGQACAGRLADGGLDVAIAEPELVGGDCAFYACMPSKALLRPAELLEEVERVPGAREAVKGDVDVPATLARRDEVIHHLDDSGQLPWLEQKGIALVRGAAALDGERRVTVGDEVLTARRAVVIATGSAAAIPPIDGLREVEPWTNRRGTTAERAPQSLVVLGGGPVGAELAQAWSSLESKVALVEAAERLLPNEEPFAGEQVADGLRERGVDVRAGTKASAVRREDGEIVVELERGEPVRGEQILVAIGRRARSEGIGLETVGVDVDGYLEVDDQLRVGDRDWLYAIGDVNGRALLTHMGKYQARAAADTILGKDAVATAEQRGSPRVTFTDPQVAAVGKTLEQAREAGIEAKAVDVETAGSAGASFVGKDTAGTSRLVVDEDRRVLVGATFVGAETAEFLHAATIAIVAEVPLDRLWQAIPAFPTRSEVWLKLMEEYGL